MGSGRPLLFGESLYYLPDGAGIQFHDAEMKGLKLPRPGLHLGEAKKGRFEPAHALALVLSPEQAAQHCLLSASSEQVQAYLKGETLNTDLLLQGWVLVSADGIPLGWAKASGGQLKNRLPKGLRHMTGL
ncbi:rRNA (cytosine-C(5)-)-methyltransferase RsmF [compost metagenome]